MNTVTEQRKLEAGEVEKIVADAPKGNGAAKPKSDRLRISPTGEKICEIYLSLIENKDMRQDYVDEFMRKHGCYECEGYKNTKCKDRLV